MQAVSRYRSRHIRIRTERYSMSIETVARASQGQSHARVSKRQRSQLGDCLSGAALIFDFAGALA